MQRIYIYAAGVCCPAGHCFTDVMSGYASGARHLKRELALIGADGLPPILAPVYGHDRVLNYSRRLRLLLDAALADCLKQFGVNLESGGIGLLLALGAVMKTSPSLPPFQRSLVQKPLPGVSSIQASYGGNAEGIWNLGAACSFLVSTNAGRPPTAVFVGAVDSFIHFEMLDVLGAQQRILSRHNSYGFIPSEGAAMLLLSAEPNLHGKKPLGAVTAFSLETEAESVVEPKGVRGRALANCIRQLSDVGPIDGVIADLNGERYRAEEYGFAAASTWGNRAERMADPNVPALQIGDQGAAAGLINCVLALGDTAKSRTLVVSGSWENGKRAAVIIESFSKTPPSTRTAPAATS